MSIREYLMTACRDDARRAGERDCQLLEARRARMAGRHRPEPAAPATATASVAPVTWLARLMFPRAAATGHPGPATVPPAALTARAGSPSRRH